MNYIIHEGDVRAVLPTLEAGSVHTCVTSPPYWGLRDYGADGQLGLESTPAEYIEKMVAVFREVRRVLRDDGTLWLNLGDSYAHDDKWGGATGGKHVPELHGGAGLGREKTVTGLKPKDLVGIPWAVAFALRADGWYLRSDIIWHKPNPMPESVTDRPTKAHEYLFLLAKSAKCYYDADAIAEASVKGAAGSDFHTGKTGGHQLGRASTEPRSDDTSTRNKRTVWTVATQPYAEAHFATYPEKLIEPCILAGCPVGGVVLDPFNGSGTTGAVAVKHGRNYVGIELNPAYIEMAKDRIGRALKPGTYQSQRPVEAPLFGGGV